MVNVNRQPTITPEALALLGAPNIAYVRPVLTDQGVAFGIFSANGTEMGIVANRDVAFAVVRQHDMEPVSVH